MRSTFDPIYIHKIADLLSDGRQLANERGRPILVSLSGPLDFDPDPAQIFYTASRIDDIRNFWSKPAEGCWIVGAGKAAEIRVKGVERFQKATNSLRTMLSSGILDEEEGGPGPIFLGGFSFKPGGSAEEIWEDFPDCLLTLPRFEVVCRGDCRRWFVILLFDWLN